MKKLILTVAAVFALGIATAQEQTAKGKLLVEVNTGFGFSADQTTLGSTSLNFFSGDKTSAYNLGIEGGYFVMDNLALKLGLGYGGVKNEGVDAVTALGYKIGAKYYVNGMIPVEVSYNGTSSDATKNPSFVGLQAGYAVFLGDMVSLEPAIRYNNSLDTEVVKSNIQFNIGFALHF